MNKVKYDHIFLFGRDINFNYTDGADYCCTMHTRQSVDMAMVRLNYKFDGPGVARY